MNATQTPDNDRYKPSILHNALRAIGSPTDHMGKFTWIPDLDTKLAQATDTAQQRRDRDWAADRWLFGRESDDPTITTTIDENWRASAWEDPASTWMLTPASCT